VATTLVSNGTFSLYIYPKTYVWWTHKYIHDSEYFLDINLKRFWKALKIDDFIFFWFVVFDWLLFPSIFSPQFFTSEFTRRFLRLILYLHADIVDNQLCYCELMLFSFASLYVAIRNGKGISIYRYHWVDGYGIRLPATTNTMQFGTNENIENFHGNAPSINDTRYVYRLKLSKNRRRW
jgi:hypothetical protein